LKLQQVLKNGNTVSVIVEKEINDKEHNTFYQQSKGNLKIASNFDELPNFIDKISCIIMLAKYRYLSYRIN
jgi:hypothetical protein